MRADDLHTSSTGRTQMFTPGPTPVLVQFQIAGNRTTSVGDLGAAALFEMSEISALLFGDLGATR